jgi:hypothetical protein
MTVHVRKYRRTDTDRIDPDFASLEVVARRFLKNWSLRQISYALEKHNKFFGTGIKIRCEQVDGCTKTRVTPGVVIRRVK